jgi:Tfp pilus assembly protein FimT
MIELVVVLLLIGVVTAMIIPEMRGTSEAARLRAAGRDLISVFHLASSRAITHNRVHRVRFEHESGRYEIVQAIQDEERGLQFSPVEDARGAVGQVDPHVSFKIRKVRQEAQRDRVKDDDLFAHNYFVQSGGRGAFTFYPDGTADPGEIILEDRDGFGLSLRINPVTAGIRIDSVERR